MPAPQTLDDLLAIVFPEGSDLTPAPLIHLRGAQTVATPSEDEEGSSMPYWSTLPDCVQLLDSGSWRG